MRHGGANLDEYQVTAMLGGIARTPHFDADAWCAPITNFGQVLKEIRLGQTDKEIARLHPGWQGDVLKVCRKIVRGELSMPGPIDEKKAKSQLNYERRLAKEREERYRKRYAKG